MSWGGWVARGCRGDPGATVGFRLHPRMCGPRPGRPAGGRVNGLDHQRDFRGALHKGHEGAFDVFLVSCPRLRRDTRRNGMHLERTRYTYGNGRYRLSLCSVWGALQITPGMLASAPGDGRWERGLSSPRLAVAAAAAAAESRGRGDGWAIVADMDTRLSGGSRAAVSTVDLTRCYALNLPVELGGRTPMQGA